MRTLYSLDDLSSISQPVHLALGVFDGVHLGHQAVIGSSVLAAHSQGGLAGVLTFDRHPLEVVAPDKAPKRLLANLRHKEKLIESLGVDVMIALRFTPELAAMSAVDFINRLTENLDLKSISVGNDWRFGKGREGGIELLRQEAERRGFRVRISPSIEREDGARISSTAIREAVSMGKFEEAREMLGRDYALIGKVVPGRKLARELGYPTANVDIYNEQLPPLGVYWAKAILPSGEEVYGIANLGRRPTVEENDEGVYLEIHLLDWAGDLYEQEIEVAFLDYIREERKFASLQELKAQITQDEEKARELMSQLPPNI